MPTILTNQARVTYNYNGGQTDFADSNETVTTMLEQYSLAATKTALTNSFRPGYPVTYQMLVTNNGRGPVYNITVTDNMGGAAPTTPLQYVTGSASVYKNGTQTATNPTSTAGNLVFTLTDPLEPGESALITYIANVRPDLDGTVATVSNSAAVAGNGGSTAGPAVAVTPSPVFTVTRQTYADVSIYKQADKSTVVAGDTLTYTFTLTNSGAVPATNVVLTDNLPTNFTVNQVSITSGGATNVVPTADYTVTAGNEITLPNNTATTTSITVPAAANGVPGTAVVTISGTVA